MKKYIWPIIVLLIIGAGIYRYRPRPVYMPATTDATSSSIVSLPGWSQLSSTDVDLKFEKKVDKGVKPQVIFKTVVYPESSSPEKYLNVIINGAKSAIPSYRILDQKQENRGGYFISKISANYKNQGKTINLEQRIYIKDKTVSVLTGSFEGDLKSEINQILDSITLQKIK